MDESGRGRDQTDDDQRVESDGSLALPTPIKKTKKKVPLIEKEKRLPPPLLFLYKLVYICGTVVVV